MILVADIVWKDYLIYPTWTDLRVIKEDIIFNESRFIILINDERITNVYRSLTVLRKILEMEKENPSFWDEPQVLDDLCFDGSFSLIESKMPVKDLLKIETDLVVVIEEDNKPLGVLDNLTIKKSLIEYFEHENKHKEEVFLEYQTIFESIEDEIFVTDQNGIVLRLNKAAEKVCGVKASDIIGKNVEELKITSKSITLAALQEKKKVNMVQEMVKTGNTFLTTAIPIYRNEEITRIISTSKNVAEINKLKEELELKNNELSIKSKELDHLREEIFSRIDFVCNSKEMDCVKETIIKVAPLDLTVMIQGESGVGKEVVSKLIHYLSNRKDQPFIKINCGLIPENLLESELFGYESGAFTGAHKNGKMGKIELAKGGTLFLDEIGEMPLSLQVKLLEFLQDRTICKVGGTKKIEINTRIITATNRDLKEMVSQRLFRQDLFYRLNVLPIVIPPLRERKDDIPILNDFFLKKFNTKYGLNVKFAPKTKEALFYYDWPGNVREFENVMERLIVTSDSNTLTPEHLNNIFELKTNDHKIICTDLIPLKRAKRILEEQLVRTAYEMYNSTYKAAKALEIDQSTVVKILKKYKVNVSHKRLS